MTKTTRWVQVESPHQRAGDVARALLVNRFDCISRLLPLAAEHFEEDVEYVHQLRVGCRRAVAAVAAMSDFLPNRLTKRYSRRLKKIRRAAGDARNDDVLIGRLKRMDGAGSEDTALVIQQIEIHRKEAQLPLEKLYRKVTNGANLPWDGQSLAAVRWRQTDPEPTFANLAHRRIADGAESFFTAGSADLNSPRNLHRFRIAAKRLRYAMEIFASTFPISFRKSLYCEIEKAQDRLGAINDHATAQAMLQKTIATLPPSATAARLGKWIAKEWADFQNQRNEFLCWWTPERAAELRREFDACTPETIAER